MPNVLLLNSDRIEAVDRLSAFEDVNLRIIVAEGYADMYRHLGGVAHVPALDDTTAVRKTALAFARDVPIHHVVAATEKSVIPAALVRAHLGVPGLTVDQAFRFTHKHAMKECLRAAGLPVAASRLVTETEGLKVAADTLDWPVVVKPVMGSAGKATFQVTSQVELGELVARDSLGPGPYQVERFIPMTAEYHCDGVVRDGTTVFTSASRYFAPLLSVGTTTFGGSHVIDQASAQAKEVAGLHEGVVAALGCRDVVTHLECFETTEGMVVGEVTCRPGGGGVPDTILAAFGVDLWDEFMRAELGQASRASAPAHASAGVSGWTYLRTGPVAAARAAELDGVVHVTKPAPGGGSYVLRLHTPDEHRMRRLHNAIGLEVGR